MTPSVFLKFLIYAGLTSVLLFFVLNFFIPLMLYIDLLWWSIVCFVLLAVVIYFLVDRSMKLYDGKSVLGLVIINVFLKLIFSFAFVAIYVQIKSPQEKIFLIPFLTTYLVFTVFETWFLNIQARGVK